MGRRSKKINPNQLQRGDHIYTDRKGKLYDHHGIYVGDDRVIHFSRFSPEKGSKYICPHGGDDTTTDNTSTVRKTCVNCFRRVQRRRHVLYKYEYNEGFWAMLKVHSSRTSADGPDTVVDRANHWLKVGNFGDYNLLWNNCETFAYYCKTGILRVSKQVLLGVAKIGAGVGMPLRAPPPCLGEIGCLGPPPCLGEIGCLGPKTFCSSLAHPCFGPKLNAVPTLTLQAGTLQALQAETGNQHTPIQAGTLQALQAETGNQHTPIQAGTLQALQAETGNQHTPIQAGTLQALQAETGNQHTPIQAGTLQALQAETGNQHTPIQAGTLQAETGNQHTPIQLPFLCSDLLPPSSEAVKVKNEESCNQ